MVYEERNFRETVINIVCGASVVISSVKDSNEISKKGHGNFVTSVDLQIEKYLQKELGNLLPEAGFIGEEFGEMTRGKMSWIMDPIDGTTNFIHGYDYAVSVALQIDGETELGVVYAPVSGTLYYAQKNKGAFKRNIVNGEEERIYACENTMDEGIIIFGVPYNRSKAARLFNIVENLYKISSDIKRIGPASVDLCRVAEGKAKAYVELDLKIWDIAAGELILREAGGEVCKEEDLYICGHAGTVGHILDSI